MTKDPIGFEGGINQYSYVLNNPVNYVDPFGLDIFIVGRIPWFTRFPSWRYVAPKNVPKTTACDPKFTPTKAPTPEQLGVPPDDSWWQQDPALQDPLKPKTPYNPNNPPKSVPVNTPTNNGPYDPIINPGGRGAL